MTSKHKETRSASSGLLKASKAALETLGRVYAESVEKHTHFFACTGPAHHPVPMQTCYVCCEIWDLSKAITKAKKKLTQESSN